MKQHITVTKYTVPELKKLARADHSDLPKVRLAVLGDCATQHISEAVRGVGAARGLDIQLYDADYDQLDAQILDQKSELYRFSPDVTLLFMCTERLYKRYTETPDGEREGFADKVAAQIKRYHDCFLSRSRGYLIQTLYPEYDDRALGNLGGSVRDSFIYQTRKLNLLISDMCAEQGRAYTVDMGFLQNSYGRVHMHDEKLYGIAKLPYSVGAVPAVAEQIVNVICAVRGSVKKCVVLDLDGTLWGGVIGDDGIENIELGELGIGHAFTQFQSWLKELKKRGIILAVCSKNNEDTAKEPFLRHPEMVLKLSDFAVFVANWEDKAGNIKKIAQTLNIGTDSIVFIDDNPFERGVVRSLVPEVTVPEMPEDPAEYVDFLRAEGLFETASFSAEDAVRTERYLAEGRRGELAAETDSYEEYLAALEMTATAEPFTPFWQSRIAQLTQRSNQFNLRTVRYTDGDIKRIAEDPRYLTLCFTLRDRFGEHGMISVVILEREDEGSLFVDTWLMSCRVLRRGMEEFVMNSIMALAKREGAPRVIGEYLPTAKNSMVAQLYEKMGFTACGEGRLEMKTADYAIKDTYIKAE